MAGGKKIIEGMEDALAFAQGDETRGTLIRSPRKLKPREAFWTFDETAAAEHGYRLFYFWPKNAKPGPYRKQIHVEAIIDVADDGTLAGVELIERMPPPPKDT